MQPRHNGTGRSATWGVDRRRIQRVGRAELSSTEGEFHTVGPGPSGGRSHVVTHIDTSEPPAFARGNRKRIRHIHGRRQAVTPVASHSRSRGIDARRSGSGRRGPRARDDPPGPDQDRRLCLPDGCAESLRTTAGFAATGPVRHLGFFRHNRGVRRDTQLLCWIHGSPSSRWRLRTARHGRSRTPSYPSPCR